MREILFKAKRIDNWEWVEGYYVNCRMHQYILPIFNDTAPEHGYDDRYEEWIEVDESTICQYTGLTDKNGRKIFENDIVAPQLPLITNIPFPVAYHNNQASFVGVYLDYEKSFAINKETLEKCEIIGNTFDNLELLEGGK